MPFYMEENLDVSMRQLIEVIQQRILTQSTYFGIRTVKCPLDFWVYQELVFEYKPDVIVEIGNLRGGSTLALAHLCDHIGRGRVVGVDLSHLVIDDLARTHPRITWIEGDACRSFERVRACIGKDDRVLIIDDSSHLYQDTLDILRTYSALLNPGDYFIVEDGNLHHGLPAGDDPGPFAAVERFLQESTDFDLDRTRESFGITWNPKGYLRRVKRTGNVPKPTPRPALTWWSTKHFIKLFVPPVFLRLWRMIKKMRQSPQNSAALQPR